MSWTSYGFIDAVSGLFFGKVELYIPITVGTGVYLLSDSPKANDIMELRSIGQV
ncbi:MAG: hypothetical protein J7K51_08015 [Thermotogae bacterium]|nr:hypothetical protein [Thermotogota bacterium]